MVEWLPLWGPRADSAMISFLGTSTHTLDEKCRLIIPKRFMDEVAPKDAVFTLTAGLDGCLLLMDRGSWEATEAQLHLAATADRHQRAVRRVLLGHADKVQPDRTNRIPINEALRAYLGVTANAEVVLAGTGNSIEIWTPQGWAEALGEARQLREFFEKPVERSAATPAV